MANVGDFVLYDGVTYKVASVAYVGDDAHAQYELASIRSLPGQPARIVLSPVKTYTLVEDGGGTVEGLVDADITPVSKTTAVANAVAAGKVRVTFDSNGGSAVAAQVVDEGAVVAEPIAPTRSCYTFAGWFYDDDTFANGVTFATDEFTTDDVLYAKWTINTFTVTYDSNEGSAVASETVNCGSAATEPNDPTLLGNRFDGWYTDDETFLEAFDFETPITANITLYAKWVLQVTVTFDSNEGSAVDAQVIDKGGLATEPDAPTLAGNTFAGWFYDDTTFLDAVDFATDIFEADDTLYAKWDI